MKQILSRLGRLGRRRAIALEAAAWGLLHGTAPARQDADLIYDVGLHKGQDTAFYLKKGYRVVAVEANPLLADAVRKRFATSVATGQLTVVNVGIVAEPSALPLPFYVNEEITEWSSFSKALATREGHRYHVSEVPVTTLGDLIAGHGAPFFVKIDIEGNDAVALASLLDHGFRPRFLSVENGNCGMLGWLVAAGYDRFKYVQQRNMSLLRLRPPAHHGRFVNHAFEPGASGPFGDEADGPWLDADAARQAIARVWDPDGTGKNPRHDDRVDGWFDLHAAYSG